MVHAGPRNPRTAIGLHQNLKSRAVVKGTTLTIGDVQRSQHEYRTEANGSRRPPCRLGAESRQHRPRTLGAQSRRHKVPACESGRNLHMLSLKKDILFATTNVLSLTGRKREVIADPLADWELRIVNTSLAPWELKVVGAGTRPVIESQNLNVLLLFKGTYSSRFSTAPPRGQDGSQRNLSQTPVQIGD